MLVRFCQGRPVSVLTTAYLAWACPTLWERGIRVLVMFWDNASWHISREVRGWIREWNRAVKKSGEGTRLLVHRLPSKSPWLNCIEPKWVHAKRAVSEPLQILSGEDLAERVCRHYQCENQEWLKEPSGKP